MNKTEKHFSLQEDKKKGILKKKFYHDKWQTIILLDFWKYCKILLKSTRFCKNLKVAAGNCKMLQDSIKFLQDFAKFYQDSVMLKWKIFKVSLKSYKIVCTHETDSFLEEWFLVSSKITWDINTKSLNSNNWVHGPSGSIFDQKTAKKEPTSEWHKMFPSIWIFDFSQKSTYFRPGE